VRTQQLYKRGVTWHCDVTVAGIRYRQTLGTSNWQDAQRRLKELIGAAVEGKAAIPGGSFASLKLMDALDKLIAERIGRVSVRTSQIDSERSRPVKRLIGDALVRKVDGQVVRGYQDARKAEGVSHRTINMETLLIRLVLKKAKRWAAIAEDVDQLPESSSAPIARVLASADKAKLMDVAASKPEWDVAFNAAVIAANTASRKIELLTLRWSDVNLEAAVMSIARSKTAAGHRTIPLNADAADAFVRLRQRAEEFGGGEPEHFIFPACENGHGHIDFTRPQKSFRTAWRSLTRASGLKGLRFHDLRHQAITELAEAGAPEATMKSIAGHVSHRMLEHYSHVRMEAKRRAVELLSTSFKGAKS
jgi:integrase